MDPLTELLRNDRTIPDLYTSTRPASVNFAARRFSFQKALFDAMGSFETEQTDTQDLYFNQYQRQLTLGISDDTLLSSLVDQAEAKGVITSTEAMDMRTVQAQHQKLAMQADTPLFTVLNKYMPSFIDDTSHFSLDRPASAGQLVEDIRSLEQVRLGSFKKAAAIAIHRKELTTDQMTELKTLIADNQRFIDLMAKVVPVVTA